MAGIGTVKKLVMEENQAIDKREGLVYTSHTEKPVVTVAQSAELWIVAPAVVGSSPIGHPFCLLLPVPFCD